MASGGNMEDREGSGEVVADSSQKWQAIFEAATEGMIILDDELRYVEVNPAACRMMGRAREEIVGREVGVFSEDRKAARELLQKVLDPNGSTARPRGDGSCRGHYAHAASPVRT